MDISIVEVETPPYLRSSDCINGYISSSKLHIDKEKEMIFWNTKEGSTLFRVLWLDEEIARCEISAGACEIYIP